MKKKFFYTLMLAVLAIFPITFAGCGNKATISGISVIATNETFNYSAETNTISIVYGTNIELKKEDFNVTAMYSDNSTKTVASGSNDLKLDLSEVEGGTNTLNVGTYSLKFTYKQKEASVNLSVTPKEIFAPTLTSNSEGYNAETQSFVYDGTEKFMSFSGLNQNTMEVVTSDTSLIKATDANTYTVKVNPKSNYKWADNFDGLYTWTIEKKPIVAPILENANIEWTGSLINITSFLEQYDSNIMSAVNDAENNTIASATELGNYRVNIVLNANHSWSTDFDGWLDWKIVKKAIEKPTVTSSNFTYNKTEQTPTISGFDTSTMEYLTSSTLKATKAGSYNINVKLKDTSHYYWKGTNNDTANAVCTWTIEKLALTTPTLQENTDVFIYNTQEQKPVLVGYDPNTMKHSSTSKTAATNAGNYNIILELVDSNNYKWKNSASNTSTVTWKIVKKSLAKPTIELMYITYSVEPSTPTISGYDNSLMTIKDNSVLTATNIGSYKIYIDLKDTDNYCWAGSSLNNTSTVNLTWNIVKLYLQKPTLETSTYTYDGELKTPTISGLDESYMEIVTEESTLSATDAGEYHIVIKLKDKNNTQWNTRYANYVDIENITLTYVIEASV